MDDPIGGQLLIQFLLILVNAFFAATEIAVISLNENKVRRQAEEGDAKAALMLKLAESPNDFLSTIQVCITLSGFLASAFAADHFASRLSKVLTDAGFTLLSPGALNTLCLNKEAIISRGQLIEIGGSFRLPDVMEKSGAIMREIGTTNKTRLRDYEKAITPQTGAIVVAHTSNYRVVGFTEEPELAEIVALAHRHQLPLLHDLGGGVLVDLRRYGLPYEPLVQDSLAAGADVVTFSGDKVLGGPQSGLIVGRESWIRKIHANPLMRALRCDKLVFAALEATLRLYFEEGGLPASHPALAMLAEPAGQVRMRAEKVVEALAPEVKNRFAVTIQASAAQAGSGALPLEKIPSHAVVLSPPDGRAEYWAARLRGANPPVLGYIQEERIWLDLRTIREEETPALCSALSLALAERSTGSGLTGDDRADDGRAGDDRAGDDRAGA